MELLSLTYIIFDILCLITFILGFIYKWYLILIGILSYFLYPIFYETFLKIFFTLLEKFKSNKDHPTYHLKLSSYNQIVYDDIYNIRVMGLEKQSPFDSLKSGRIHKFLQQEIDQKILGKFNKPGNIDYSFIYTNISLKHLILLNYSLYLTKIAEVPVFYLPASILRILTLRRFIYATQGTLKACCLALEKKIAFNLGGGYHHAHKNGGSGFCFYNDIGLAVQHLRKYHSDYIKNILILDLDAHQGNGHERDKIYYKDDKVYIIDFYNNYIFPQDNFAKSAINDKLYLNRNTSDEEFLESLQQKLFIAQMKFKPNFIIYNAGTDILQGDRLGQLSISSQGVIQRDQIVINFALQNNIPLLYLLSGGYQKNNAKIISKSLIEYLNKQLNQKIYK